MTQKLKGSTHCKTCSQCGKLAYTLKSEIRNGLLLCRSCADKFTCTKCGHTKPSIKFYSFHTADGTGICCQCNIIQGSQKRAEARAKSEGKVCTTEWDRICQRCYRVTDIRVIPFWVDSCWRCWTPTEKHYWYPEWYERDAVKAMIRRFAASSGVANEACIFNG